MPLTYFLTTHCLEYVIRWFATDWDSNCVAQWLSSLLFWPIRGLDLSPAADEKLQWWLSMLNCNLRRRGWHENWCCGCLGSVSGPGLSHKSPEAETRPQRKLPGGGYDTSITGKYVLQDLFVLCYSCPSASRKIDIILKNTQKHAIMTQDHD